jgi:transcriptional regulator with XRE-family HTH domain
MNLKTYLVARNISRADFCRMIGCTRGYLSSIIHGNVKPGNRLLKDIVEITGGNVTKEEILMTFHISENERLKQKEEEIKQEST